MLLQIDERKITHYLLASPSKAPFFLRAGYELASWVKLRDDLLKHPEMARHEGVWPDRWGTKTAYLCAMPVAPNGRQYCIRKVWQLSADGLWKLITAYPQQEQRIRP